MDLALNNLQRLICHKTQQNNQPTKWYTKVDMALNKENQKKKIYGFCANKPFIK